MSARSAQFFSEGLHLGSLSTTNIWAIECSLEIISDGKVHPYRRVTHLQLALEGAGSPYGLEHGTPTKIVESVARKAATPADLSIVVDSPEDVVR